MLISGIFGKRNIYALNVRIEFPDEIYAGTPFLVKILVTNPRRIFPAFLIRIVMAERDALFPFVLAGSTMEQTLEMVIDKRGRFHFERPFIASIFPFNFFTRYRKIDERLDIIVYPKPKRCWLATSNRLRYQSRGDRQILAEGDDGELFSIRDYLPGDAIKNIHWKSTAKTDQLKTKEFSRSDLNDVIIDFDKISIQDLEEKLSCAAYLILRLFRANIPVGLNINGEKFAPGLSADHKRTLLKTLALYGED